MVASQSVVMDLDLIVLAIVWRRMEKWSLPERFEGLSKVLPLPHVSLSRPDSPVSCDLGLSSFTRVCLHM